MKHKLYPRLAWQSITKNKRLYLPFLLTCVGMVMMTYILLSLASSPILKTFPGGDTMPMILSLGSFVMAAFAVLFLFYTNSFLIRRRNREFGLYNILGMGKGNLAKVLAWETVIMAILPSWAARRWALRSGSSLNCCSSISWTALCRWILPSPARLPP